MEQREKRLAQLRQREIERRNRCVNGILVEENSQNPQNPLKTTKSPTLSPGKRRTTTEALDELDPDEIDLLPTNLSFDTALFTSFCTKMDHLFSEIHGYGLLQYDMKRDWETIKTQVTQVARARIKTKDQR